MNRATMSSMMRMNSDHDAKISFWPASGSVAACQLSWRVEWRVREMDTIRVGVCSLAFCDTAVSMEAGERQSGATY